MINCPKELQDYPGSKNQAGVYQNIINRIPPFKTFVEPFAGSAGIARRIYTGDENVILSDIDTCIIDIWNYDGPEEWIKVSMRALELIKLVDLLATDVFFYLDPPYPLSSRRTGREYYKHEMSDDDHIQLLSTILQLKNNCMISTYPNDLYDQGLKDWSKVEFETRIRTGMATEVIYFNYEEPIDIHTTKYVGSNFTDRQRIKRKVDRFNGKLSSMPAEDRNAILRAIKQNFL